MITVHTLYDPAVFLTDKVSSTKSLPRVVCVQSEVEQPEIYMFSLDSSSVEDQPALIGDRVECLADSSIFLDCEKRKIKDTLRFFFFTGDHPAAQFNLLWAIDANWHHIHNVRYGRLTPNGVKATFSCFSCLALGYCAGLWLATNPRYSVMASGRAIINYVGVTETIKQAAPLPLRSTRAKVQGCYC